MRGATCTLVTDVSNFYPSIYTHAVDWAIRGKAAAKADRSARTLGGKIDGALRRSRDGQTIGISIGPDTSWLIAELVLSRVDEALLKRFPHLIDRGFRWVDDVTLYTQSGSEAEQVLGSYQEELARFELSLNPSKTRIFDGILPTDELWLIQLRQARYRDDNDKHLTNDVTDLFDLAFQFAHDNPSSNAISYAIKRCNPFPAGTAWSRFQQYVLTAAVLEPACLSHVHDIYMASVMGDR